MLNWLGGIVATIVSGVVVWWLTVGTQTAPTGSTSVALPGSAGETSSGSPAVATHCEKPTTPVLERPGDNQVVPNHSYGEGTPWRFRWLASSCEGGSIRGYRLIVISATAKVPAIDEIVDGVEYAGNTGGTIGAPNWTWKVQAIDDRNQLSNWSEQRRFIVGAWKK